MKITRAGLIIAGEGGGGRISINGKVPDGLSTVDAGSWDVIDQTVEPVIIGGQALYDADYRPVWHSLGSDLIDPLEADAIPCGAEFYTSRDGFWAAYGPTGTRDSLGRHWPKGGVKGVGDRRHLFLTEDAQTGIGLSVYRDTDQPGQPWFTLWAHPAYYVHARGPLAAYSSAGTVKAVDLDTQAEVPFPALPTIRPRFGRTPSGRVYPIGWAHVREVQGRGGLVVHRLEDGPQQAIVLSDPGEETFGAYIEALSETELLIAGSDVSEGELPQHIRAWRVELDAAGAFLRWRREFPATGEIGPWRVPVLENVTQPVPGRIDLPPTDDPDVPDPSPELVEIRQQLDALFASQTETRGYVEDLSRNIRAGLNELTTVVGALASKPAPKYRGQIKGWFGTITITLEPQS